MTSGTCWSLVASFVFYGLSQNSLYTGLYWILKVGAFVFLQFFSAFNNTLQFSKYKRKNYDRKLSDEAETIVLWIGWDFINNKYIIIASLKDFDRWLIKWSMIGTSQVVVYIILWFSFILCLMYILLFHVLVIYHAFIFFNINTHSLKDSFDLQHLHQQAWNCKVL